MKIKPAIALLGVALSTTGTSALADSDWQFIQGNYNYYISNNSVFQMDDTEGYEYLSVKTNQRNKKACQTPESDNVTLTLNRQGIQGERHIWQKKGECQITLVIRGRPALDEFLSIMKNNQTAIIRDITGAYKISSDGFDEMWTDMH